jgi:hypothetical protein
VFVGRSDELSRFAVLLGALPLDRKARMPGWPRRQRLATEQGEVAASRVILVHGLGGSGKSRLLRQFQEMVEGRLPSFSVLPGRVRTVYLDWEDERRYKPASYASADGPNLVTVLNALQHAVIDAAGPVGKAKDTTRQAFAGYRDGAARMPQYAGRFADVIMQAQHASSAVSSQDVASLLKSLTSAGLAAAGHPYGLVGLIS